MIIIDYACIPSCCPIFVDLRGQGIADKHQNYKNIQSSNECHIQTRHLVNLEL